MGESVKESFFNCTTGMPRSLRCRTVRTLPTLTWGLNTMGRLEVGILTFGDYDGSYNLTDPQSFNRYSYPQNDPVNFVDPSGLDDDPPGGWPDDLVTTEWIYTSAPYWPGSGFGGGEMGLLERRPVGGNPLITVPSSTPTPTPQKPKSPVEQAFDKARAACLARKKAEADKARSEYRN